MNTVKAILMAACAVVGLCAFGDAVQAQDGPVPEVTGGGEGDGTVYKKETVYDFDDDLVEGALVKPDGDLVSGELHGKTSSLIKIRSDFIPEMIKSVEDL